MRLGPIPTSIAPRGFRWPWYPIYLSEVRPVGTTTVGDCISITYEAVGDTTRELIGLRRWVNHWWSQWAS